MSISAATGITDRFMVRPRLDLPEGYGGILGREISALTYHALGTTGMTIFLVTLLLTGISLLTSLSWLSVLEAIGRYGQMAIHHGHLLLDRLDDVRIKVLSSVPLEPLSEGKRAQGGSLSQGDARPLRQRPSPQALIPVAIDPEAETMDPPMTKGSITIAPRRPEKAFDLPPAAPGALPPLELLNSRVSRVKGYSKDQLEDMSRQLELILDDFGVEVQVVEVHPGPVITRFEVQPAPGVKVSRISGLAKDLARTLSVTSVRVVEIIPGKTVIGLEIPNEERETVLLHSVLASEAYQGNPSPLTLTLGKDISGQPVVANLARMPHLLVAGTTGSGKSVAVNVMILSMLFKARPEDVRLIMIDPKMLELSIYEGIPHLLTPVVTDMKEAANALRWCVAEMERRYKLMSRMGVRNLAGFNQKIRDAIEQGEPIKDPLWVADLFAESQEPKDLEPLPFIVIVIDELADMMMIVGKKVEELIARLAQKARAAGLHLILATQRPSVDVITGLIKANIPTRIGFQVSSKIDSRTILDQGGAESLLGNGDMLYLPPGTGLPMRAHGAFVSDEEVHLVVEFLKRTGPTNYIHDITRFSDDAGGDGGSFRATGDSGDETDALYDEAVRFVTESRKASISSVQRKFKVGYNRAARMMDEMEQAGIVGPAETNGSREVIAPPPPEL
jgi:S-DNA-T family DNA segregation ATPase FtsK/SpoIIIE